MKRLLLLLLAVVFALNISAQKDFMITKMNLYSLSNIYSNNNLSEEYRKEVYNNIIVNTGYLLSRLQFNSWQENYKMPIYDKNESPINTYRIEIIKVLEKVMEVDSNLVKKQLLNLFNHDYINNVSLNENVVYVLIRLEKNNNGWLSIDDVELINDFLAWHYAKYKIEYWKNILIEM